MRRSVQWSELTDAAIAKAKPAAEGTIAYFLRDATLPGLGVRVSEPGRKVFIFEARLNGRPRRWTIGPYPDFSLSLARVRARAYRRDVVEGLDPGRHREERREAPSLGEICERWLENHAKPNKRSWQEDERRIEDFLGPWKNRRLDEISVKDVLGLQQQVAAERGPVGSNRLIALLRAMLRKARDDWRLVSGSLPTDGVRLYEEQPRERILGTEELARLIRAILVEPDLRWRRIFLLYLLTGQRRREVLSARRTDVDFAAGRWHFPSRRRKNKRPHVLPLTPVVRAILESIEPVDESPYLFPSWGGHGHLTEPKKAWKRILERAEIEDLHVHDLRHAQGTLQAMIGSSLPMIAKILGQADPNSALRYVNLAVEPMRDPLERAERRLISHVPELGALLGARRKRRARAAAG